MSLKVKKALEHRGVFEVINYNSTDKKLRFTGRVHSVNSGSWVLVVQTILDAATGADWSTDISRFYFLQDTSAGKKLFYAWRVIFEGDIAAFEDSIAGAILRAPLPSVAQIEEIALGGNRTANRNIGARGKGAFPAGTVPLAVLQQMRGGGGG